MLTLGNLLCGTGAAIALLTQHDYKLAFYLVVASAVCDFFDGFAARLLKQSSPLGVQLDSLADMVSFGVVPAVAMRLAGYIYHHPYHKNLFFSALLLQLFLSLR